MKWENQQRTELGGERRGAERYEKGRGWACHIVMQGRLECQAVLCCLPVKQRLSG